MKRQVPALKLVRETVRELSGHELSQAAGGVSQTTCFCSGIECDRNPSQLLNPCIAISGLVCHAVSAVTCNAGCPRP